MSLQAPEKPHPEQSDGRLPSVTQLFKHRLFDSLSKTLAKGHLIDSEVKSYGIFPSFSPLDPELTPGQRIIDIFSDRFSFNLVNKSKKGKKQPPRSRT